YIIEILKPLMSEINMLSDEIGRTSSIRIFNSTSVKKFPTNTLTSICEIVYSFDESSFPTPKTFTPLNASPYIPKKIVSLLDLPSNVEIKAISRGGVDFITLTCLNISSLRYEDSGSYKGVSHLKDGVIVTTTMNISVKANIIDLTGRVCYLTRNYCEVKIRCEIKSFALNGSITPLHMILGTLDRWKYLPFPTDDYRYVGELKRYISGNPYPIESLALEISATFNRFTIVKNNDDEFSCYLFSQNYSFHKMLNARHICESEWEALNNNNDNSSSMPVSHNNRANDLSSMMSQLQNDNDDHINNKRLNTILVIAKDNFLKNSTFSGTFIKENIIWKGIYTYRIIKSSFPVPTIKSVTNKKKICKKHCFVNSQYTTRTLSHIL
nr:C9L product [variola virus VAR, India-1967, Peptide, 381 aa] [Variola virus]